MNQRIYLCSLYDRYKDLLTDKQQIYFEEYYFNNLSLGEISENLNISRNAVFRQLKTITDKLEYYERLLGLFDKHEVLLKIINEVSDPVLKSKLEQLDL